jgi:hypothetical protein
LLPTRFEGRSVGDAKPDSASASASVATVRSADVGVCTGKGAGDSAAASAPVYKKKSAELRKRGECVPEDGGKDSKKVYRWMKLCMLFYFTNVFCASRWPKPNVV